MSFLSRVRPMAASLLLLVEGVVRGAKPEGTPSLPDATGAVVGGKPEATSAVVGGKPAAMPPQQNLRMPTSKWRSLGHPSSGWGSTSWRLTECCRQTPAATGLLSETERRQTSVSRPCPVSLTG